MLEELLTDRKAVDILEEPELESESESVQDQEAPCVTVRQRPPAQAWLGSLSLMQLKMALEKH